MASNFLEQLVFEWFEYRGYFVRRNVLVGPRANGGYDAELDVVAFHPQLRRLVHVEPSTDTDSWQKREEKYQRKFAAGRAHVPALFGGVADGLILEQQALLVYGARDERTTLGGGTLIYVESLLQEIVDDLLPKRVRNAAVPEQYPLLRAIQFTTEHRAMLFGMRAAAG
jgi:hypothetical protein